MILYCATTNAGKLREFRAGAPERLCIEPLPAIRDVPVPEETGSTFEENAVQKALHYGAYTAGWLIAEDSGLEVEALGGAPGVWSARYAGPGATDEDNNRKLASELGSAENRRARYVCAIALVHAGNVEGVFRGAVEGEIAREPRGSNGFGYDPWFFYPPFGCTFGEATQERKLAVSHRAAALAELSAYVRGAQLLSE